jgi:hypothetical protein
MKKFLRSFPQSRQTSGMAIWTHPWSKKLDEDRLSGCHFIVVVRGEGWYGSVGRGSQEGSKDQRLLHHSGMLILVFTIMVMNRVALRLGCVLICTCIVAVVDDSGAAFSVRIV